MPHPLQIMSQSAAINDSRSRFHFYSLNECFIGVLNFAQKAQGVIGAASLRSASAEKPECICSTRANFSKKVSTARTQNGKQNSPALSVFVRSEEHTSELQ